MANPVDDAGNVRVDFVWGNLPMQPDDQRGGNTLDMALDNHVIVQNSWAQYPGFEANDPGVLDYITVPNIVGDLHAAAVAALAAVGLALGAETTTHVGATVANDGKVKTQTPAAAATVDPVPGSSAPYGTVAVVEYLAPTVPNVVGMTDAAAGTALVAAFLTKGTVSTTTAGSSNTISNVALTTNVVTITTGTAHGFINGQTVAVAAVTNTAVNGSFVITVVDATNFTYALTHADILTGADTGTVVVTALIGKVEAQALASGTKQDENTAVNLVEYA